MPEQVKPISKSISSFLPKMLVHVGNVPDGTDNVSCLWSSGYITAFAITVPSAWNSLLSPTFIHLADSIPYLKDLAQMLVFFYTFPNSPRQWLLRHVFHILHSSCKMVLL